MPDPAAPLSLLRHFAALPDPRDHRARKHALTDVVVIALGAVLCDAQTWADSEEFGNAQRAFFARFLKLANGVPSHDTFNRVFAALDPAAFQTCFTAWIHAVAARLEFPHVAIDGKAARGTAGRAAGLGCLHTVSVWAADHGLCFAQEAVAEESNEIPAIPRLLHLLDLEGALVTIDALGCQKDIATAVRAAGADYVLAVKENQPTLHADVAACFDRAIDADFAGVRYAECADVEDGHGRHEERY